MKETTMVKIRDFAFRYKTPIYLIGGSVMFFMTFVFFNATLIAGLNAYFSLEQVAGIAVMIIFSWLVCYTFSFLSSSSSSMKTCLWSRMRNLYLSFS